MKTDYLRIAPSLDLLVVWGSRMSEAFRKRYWAVTDERPEASERLRQEYARWCQARDAAYDQIHRFFKLTASLPVVGDHLTLGGTSCESLRIEIREVFASTESDEFLLVYHVGSTEIEEFEVYQEGDLIDEHEDE